MSISVTTNKSYIESLIWEKGAELCFHGYINGKLTQWGRNGLLERKKLNHHKTSNSQILPSEKRL